MDVTQTMATAAAVSQSKSTEIASDYQTFLNMLTVQLENQDPLSPVDSDDFAVQLATFSQVEQQTLTNDLIREQNQYMLSAGLGDMVGWVGKEARTLAPAQFDGTTAIELAPLPFAVADKAVLIVRDQWGSIVQEADIPVSTDPYFWDGVDENGQSLPTGKYSFELASYEGDELLGQDPVEVYSKIQEVQLENNRNVLLLEGGIRVTADSVTAFRGQ